MRKRKTDVGDAVDGLQAGRVILLDLDDSGAQLADPCGKIAHPPNGIHLAAASVSRQHGWRSSDHENQPANRL